MKTKNNLSPKFPKVGIFWIYRHAVVFKHSVPLSEGLHYGDAVTGIKDHADYWEELRVSGEFERLRLPEELCEEYFSIPRGRVVYHSETQKFSVYHGNNISKSDLKLVQKEFNLPPAKTVFEEDLHYCDFSDEEWNSL